MKLSQLFRMSWLSVIATPALLVTAPVVVQVDDFSFSPTIVKVAQGGTVEWNFVDPVQHTVTDRSGMGLFDSGERESGAFPFAFVAGGSYRYVCDLHPSMTGSVRVPVNAAPTSGGGATTFTIMWASTNAPDGYRYDVQIRRPGSTTWSNWKIDRTSRSASFKPNAGSGVYTFRSRLERISNLETSGWSKPRTIAVN